MHASDGDGVAIEQLQAQCDDECDKLPTTYHGGSQLAGLGNAAQGTVAVAVAVAVDRRLQIRCSFTIASRIKIAAKTPDVVGQVRTYSTAAALFTVGQV